MTYSQIFKNCFKKFKDNKAKYLNFCFAWTSVVSLLASLMLLGIIDVFTFFMLFLFFSMPVAISFSLISLKEADGKIVNQKDFYIGFKGFLPSVMVEWRVYLLSFFLAFVAAIFSFGIFLWIDLILFHPDVVNQLIDVGVSAQAYTDIMDGYLQNISGIENDLIIFGPFIVAYFVFVILKAKKMLIVYICLNSPMHIEGAKRYVKNSFKGYTSKLIGYSLLFALFLLFGFAIGYGLNLLLDPLNSNLALLIGMLVFCLITSLAIPIKYLFYAQVYNLQLKAQITAINEKFFKDKMPE